MATSAAADPSANTAPNTDAPLVPANRDGVEIRDDWDGMGHRLSASGSVHLDNVRIEASELNVIKAVGGPYARRHNAGRAQLHLMAVIAGILRNVVPTR